ncbi:MAG: M1 family metallopeptidase [Bacteroidia bacterium]|nr:M1 family metallopeptidase [Bacteroidia bacterium]
MKKTGFLLIFIGVILFNQTLIGQETRFFMPKEIQKAYSNGTRSYDGKPGEKYWQNTVDYDIDVEVIPGERTLKGKASITYTNNSPDELNSIIIRLYQDVFRKANPRAQRVSEEDINDGVIIKKLIIGETEIDLNNRRTIRRQNSNMRVSLSSQPIPAGAKQNFELEWESKVPLTTVRGGAYDSTSFFVSYWYPQIAVYDDVFGWDNLAYDLSTEFYNNLSNFDVRITAPDSFVVLSTGVLQNPDEIMEGKILERFNQAKTSTETISIIDEKNLEGTYHFKSGSWNYKADEVTDFAFCLSDHYCWDAANQKIEDRNVFVNSFYPQVMRQRANQLTSIQQKTMKHFSESVPGIPYPYPEFTTFVAIGGGGMEYPMMANNGNPGLGVTVHEMFHTYFPMYVRINEKRFAWMDEGWADFTTGFVIRRFFQEDEKEAFFGTFAGQVQGTMGSLSDLPLITSTQFMDNSNYGYASYPLPAFLYSILYDELGEETFMKCWQEYIRRWAKKSPTPYDFFYTFENVSGQDLSWFWKPWFFNYGNVDVSIASFKKGKLIVNRNASRPTPISLLINYEDGTSKTENFKAGNWKDSDEFTTKVDNYKEVKNIIVNYNLPDNNLLDNCYPSLQEQYGEFTIQDEMLGAYAINEFRGFDIWIRNKDGVVYAEVPGFFGAYMIPISATEFVGLDGVTKLTFTKEGSKYKSLKLSSPSNTITADK